MSEFAEAKYRKFLSNKPKLETKKDKIVALMAEFGWLDSKAAMKVVDCSKGYLKRFCIYRGEPSSWERDRNCVVWEGENRFIADRQKVRRGKELTQKEKREVLERDNYRCVFCGSTENLLVHHVIPPAYFPVDRNKKDNLATLCKTCHRKVHKGGYTRSFSLSGLTYDNKKDFWLRAKYWPEHWKKREIKWRLEHLKGVGPKTIERLYERFGNVENILESGTKSIAKTPYVSHSTAKSIIASLAQQLPE